MMDAARSARKCVLHAPNAHTPCSCDPSCVPFRTKHEAMDELRIERLRTPARTRNRLRARLWREWCFVRAVGRRRRASLFVLFALLAGGAGLFRFFEHHDPPLSFLKAMFYTWSLVFGQPPEPFPESGVLQGLFFLVPIIGLTVIIEAIVEISQMLRDRRRNEETWCKIMASSMKDHILLVGLGRLGIRTFHILRRLGHDVVVLERNGDAPFLDEVRRDGSPILIGDARREAFLVDANVADARSIVLATTDDLANLEIALDARRLNPKIRVVMRMFDPNMAEKVKEGFQIRTVMSAASLAAPAFAVAALERDIVSSSVVDDTLVVTRRWTATKGAPITGRTVADLMRDYGIGIVERKAKGGASRLFPPPETRIDEGDVLLVQGAFDVIERHPDGAPAA